MNRAILRVVTVAVAAITLLILGMAPVAACRIDNRTSQYIRVWFDCGIGCGNYFDIARGEHASRPGQSGYVQMGYYEHDALWMCEPKDHSTRTPVDEHGQAVATLFTPAGRPDTDIWVRWTAYDEDDNNTREGQENKLTEYDLSGSKDCWIGPP